MIPKKVPTAMMGIMAVLMLVLTSCRGAIPPFSASPAPTSAPHPEAMANGATGWVKPAVIYVYDSPGSLDPSRAERAFSNRNPFGGPQVFALKTAFADWFEIVLPVRPNGTTGWIHRRDIDIRYTTHRVEVDVSARTASVYEGSTPLLRTKVVVGKRSTPTPLGTFYINVNIDRRGAVDAYGPYILGLSGFSEILSSFNGGEPTIGIHGTNRPDLLGSAASNGCVRFPNDLITFMHQVLPLGTPVVIVP